MLDFRQIKELSINGQAVVQLSLDGSVVWKKGGDAFKYDYAVLQTLADKEDNLQYQYNRADGKWYCLNNLGELEPYGVLEAVASLDDATYYKGKLVTVGDSEYEWTNGTWNYLGEKEGGMDKIFTFGGEEPWVRGNVFPTNFQVPKSQVDGQFFTPRFSGSGYGMDVSYASWGSYYTIFDYGSGQEYEGQVIEDAEWVYFTNPFEGEVAIDSIDYWGNPVDVYANTMVYPKQYEKITYNTKDGYYYDSEDDITAPFGKNLAYNIDGYLYKNIDGTYERGNNGNPYAKASAFASDTTITKMKFKDEVVDKIGNSAFSSCSNLSYIEFEETPPTIENAAFNNIASEGTLVCDDEWYDNLSATEINNLGQSYFWRIGYFYIETLSKNTTYGIRMTHQGTNATTTKPVLEYSLDEINWIEWDYSPIYTEAFQKVYFRGTNTSGIGRSADDYSVIAPGTNYNVGGNILSLLRGSDFRNYTSSLIPNYCFKRFFNSTFNIIEYKTPLPSRYVGSYSYFEMFRNCLFLTKAPKLLATSLGGYACDSMFSGCQRLTKAPELPATSLATYCYSQMFYSCSSLVEAPELPATSLATYCYYSMFQYCSELTTAPELPAKSLANNCYQGMFQYCRKLTTAPELPATSLRPSCYSQMFYNCSSLETAPDLPALVVATSTSSGSGYSYFEMFYGCEKLNKVRCKAMYYYNTSQKITKSISTNWLNGVSSTGTFYKNPDWSGPTTRGSNTIPTGWTIVDWVQ